MTLQLIASAVFLSALIPAADRPSPEVHKANLAKANASDAKNQPKAEADPSRPAFHLLGKAGWMNDPNAPIYYKGEYHLFYQHNPYGNDWGHMHWGHAKSKDLVHWTHLPIALAPSTDLGEEHCFSGGATLDKDGRPVVFYTSIGPKTPAGDGAVQWMATPTDDGLIHWEKHPANPILKGDIHKPNGFMVKDWRDPYVWKSGDEWLMVLGGHREGGKGGAYIYRSKNLTEWESLGILFEGEEGNWECPNFFKLGDKWVLIYSPHGPVRYMVGTLDEDYKFHPETKGLVDGSARFYAPNGLVDGKGRNLLWGWVQAKGESWNGSLSIPRVLTLRPDGLLGQEPATELAALRKSAKAGQRGGDGLSADFDPTDRLEIEATAAGEGAKSFTLKLTGPSSEPIEVAVDLGRNELRAGTERAEFKRAPGEDKLSIRAFVDRSILEVFVNGRACLTSPIKPRSIGRVEASAGGGADLVKSLTAWELDSAPIITEKVAEAP